MSVVEHEVGKMGRLTEQLRLVDVQISAAGLSIRGRRIYNFMADLLGETLTFTDLSLPLAMVATDIRAGREVVLRGGLVIDAVRATISIPGIFEPTELGDYRLVDGGVLNNVPVDVARNMAVEATRDMAKSATGAARVIAVDVLPSFSRNVPGLEPVEEGISLPFAPLYLNETYHVIMIMIAALTDSRLRQFPPDLLIRPTLPADVTLLSGFNRATDVIAAGDAAVMAALPAIRALVG
jgi:NTE family protein